MANNNGIIGGAGSAAQPSNPSFISSTTGGGDAGKGVETDGTGSIDPNFVHCYPSFASDGDFVAMHGGPKLGDRYYNTTTNQVRSYGDISDGGAPSWYFGASGIQTLVDMYSDTGQALTNSAMNTMDFNSLTLDAQGLVNLGANTVTIKRQGIYDVRLLATANFAVSTSRNNFITRIQLNGVEVGRGPSVHHEYNGSAVTSRYVSSFYSLIRVLNIGDVLTFQVFPIGSAATLQPYSLYNRVQISEYMY